MILNVQIDGKTVISVNTGYGNPALSGYYSNASGDATVTFN